MKNLVDYENNQGTLRDEIKKEGLLIIIAVPSLLALAARCDSVKTPTHLIKRSGSRYFPQNHK